MEDKTILAIVAILILGVLEVTAILHQIDGILLSAVVAIIAGLAGFEARDLLKK